MSTPAISNVFSVLPNQANTAKQDNSAAESGTFGQVLSREMNDQGTSAAANSTKKDGNAGNSDKSKSDNADTPTQASGKDNTKVSEDDKTVSTNTDAKVDESEVDPALAAELAAFVNALTQANPAPAAAAPAGEEIAVDLGKQLASDDTSIDLKADASTIGTASGSAKEAAGKPEDFVAALDKAAKNTESAGKAAAAPIKADIDKAIAHTIKAIEMPTAPTTQTVAAVTATNAAATLQQLNDLQNQQASNRLTPHVGTQGWDQALGQKVVWMLQGLQQTATLTLNPPELGPMQVTVNVQNNQATANFTAHQPEVRHALEAAMPRLREMLNDAGIQLSESNVSAGSSNQQGNAFADSQQNGRGNNSSSQMEATPTVSHIPVPSGGTGMVDTFA